MGHHPLNEIKPAEPPADDPAQRLLTETRSALVVVDMQIDFCAADGFVAGLGLDPGPCRAIVPELQTLIESARRDGVPVLWVMANYDDALVPPTFQRRKKEAGITRTCCVPGTEGFEPFGVHPADDEPQFIKHSYSAFTDPAFEKHLQSEKIETLVFAGVQTNICVEATLRDGFNRGFHVIVAEDCVASHTPALHDATLQNVRALLGIVTSATDIESAWQDVGRKP